MLSKTQVGVLLIWSVVLWGAATANIRLAPASVAQHPIRVFALSLPMAWLSVLATRFLAQLSPGQLLAGVCLVGAVAMAVDGAVLRFAPAVYGSDEAVLRMGAAWLLWGYGLSFAIAIVMAWRAG